MSTLPIGCGLRDRHPGEGGHKPRPLSCARVREQERRYSHQRVSRDCWSCWKDRPRRCSTGTGPHTEPCGLMLRMLAWTQRSCPLTRRLGGSYSLQVVPQESAGVTSDALVARSFRERTPCNTLSKAPRYVQRATTTVSWPFHSLCVLPIFWLEASVGQ
ncbi:hypothetical protein GWK47_015254 [Chionoecetes opilio]|uniref:Uncharacterized protein n=1 Tax=Chionoecetes opilio TaxID=41210 RepID=A0A8J5BZX6_CHIOP|nr:hypothetical protein GWK47_015254 [Chionoecetes opilio]